MESKSLWSTADASSLTDGHPEGKEEIFSPNWSIFESESANEDGDENILELDAYNFTSLTKSEFATKLLNQLDQNQDNECLEESEPLLDWFSAETKTSSELQPLLEISTPQSAYFYSHQQPQSQSQLTTATGCVPSEPHHQWLIPELTADMTPPESPKPEEIFQLLEREMEPAQLAELTRDLSSSPSSSYGVSSGYNTNSPGHYSDPDWCMSPVTGGSVIASGKKRKKSCKGGYSAEDKKLRKKEQNKDAATRYRLKKKAEVEDVVAEQRVAEEENKRLRGQADELARELKYLKSLARDIFKAKGLM